MILIQVLAQHKAVWSDEKQELKKRIEELEKKFVDTRNNLTKDTQEFNKVCQNCERLIPLWTSNLISNLVVCYMKKILKVKNDPMPVHKQRASRSS